MPENNGGELPEGTRKGSGGNTDGTRQAGPEEGGDFSPTKSSTTEGSAGRKKTGMRPGNWK